MQTLTRATIAGAFAALLSTVAGAAAAHGPDERPTGLPGPLVGAIEITNERDRPVQIYIDGRFAEEVRARTTGIIEHVPNGVRLVSYIGAGQGSAWQTDRVEVREGRRAGLRIAALRGRAVIVNRTGATLHVMVDELDLGMVPPNREVTTPPLPAGTYRISAATHGWEGARPQVQDLVIIPGEVVRVDLRAFAATLLVTNPFPDKVTVYLDGQRVAKLKRGESERFDNLQPGTVRVELRDHDRVVAWQVVQLFAGRESQFTPTRFGALEVRNATREPVRVTIDETSGFRLAPGQVRLIGEVVAGLVTIQLTTEDGRIIKHQAQINPGETQRFEVPAQWVEDPRDGAPIRPSPR